MFLAVDLGATKTLLALTERDGARIDVRFERRYADDDFASFDALVERFVADARAGFGPHAVTAACIGAAGPVVGGRVQLTNRDWVLDAAALSRRFGWPRVRIVNDFAAAASGIEALAPGDLVTLQAGEPEADGPRVVLGAGSGLGLAYAVCDGGAWRIVAGEGGHRTFAAVNDRQAALVAYWRGTLGHVSDEAFLSGPGIERLYAFERAQTGGAPTALDRALADGAGPESITAAAEAGDAVAEAALHRFVECYGQVAGDHALAVMARGGVYVAGGLAPKLLDRLRDGFVAAFRAKGTQTALMARFPVHVVKHEALGLIGAAVVASRLA
jgi:glucokinase